MLSFLKCLSNFKKQDLRNKRGHFDPSGRSRYTSIVGSSSVNKMATIRGRFGRRNNGTEPFRTDDRARSPNQLTLGLRYPSI